MGPVDRGQREHRRFRVAGSAGHHRVAARRQAEHRVTNSAGPIVTAGGLVFVGATSDNRFRAFDSKTGKELWVTKLDYTATATPMTFQGQERQAVRGRSSPQRRRRRPGRRRSSGGRSGLGGVRSAIKHAVSFKKVPYRIDCGAANPGGSRLSRRPSHPGPLPGRSRLESRRRAGLPAPQSSSPKNFLDGCTS